MWRDKWHWCSLFLPMFVLVVMLRVMTVVGAPVSHANEVIIPVIAGANGPSSIITPTGKSQPVSLTSVSTSSAISPLGVGSLSISDSSVATEDCYQDGTTQTLCFTVHNGSTDGEWLDQVRLTFPPGPPAWTVACHSQDASDSAGYPVNFNCTPSSNEARYDDSDADGYGEVSQGSSWGFCVDVTVPAGYDGNRIINWGLSGDEDGTTPHDIEGTITIEHCTPLWFKSANRTVEGCNGITQTHTMELRNISAGSGTFALTYDVSPAGSLFTGPSSFDLSIGEIVTFTVQLKPDFFLRAGEQVTATLSASGGGHSDTSTIVNTITDLSGWQSLTDTLVATMDNVVVWASYADGGLWSIGGYGSDGATQRYDPSTDTWTTFQPETAVTPTIEYPMDGCYGRNEAGNEIVVLFPDTIVTNTLHVFNITTKAWSTRTIPVGYPAVGRWGHDVVSLLNNPSVKAGVEKNVCYLSGGSTQEGGGRTKDLWTYYPETNTIGPYRAFPADVWFGFHASWYVPWVGEKGAICVGGGVDHNHQINDTTQCYDLATQSFNALNADLGPLPERWWGMADGWQVQDGRYQIWIANGVAQDGTLLPASAYADETTGGFGYGPGLPVGLYRLEGDGYDGQFYTVGGSQGGFWYSKHNLLLVQCPECNDIYLPLVVRNYGG